MREAHLHLGALGESLSLLNLERCANLTRMLERLREAAEAGSPATRTEQSHQAASATSAHRTAWVRGFGARAEAWPEARWPSLEELDGATGTAPTVVMSFDYHTAIANSAAMRAAGLAPGGRVGRNGEVVADGRGRATGLLHEDAAYAAWNAAPEPTAGQRRRDVLRALKLLQAMGFDEVHDLHSPSWLGPMLGELDRADALRARCVLYAPADRLRSDAAERHLWESDRVRLGGGKVFADGTLNSRTALMLTPYAHPDPCIGPLGKAMVTRAELDGHLRMCGELGLELAVHAIGDGAVRMVLDAYEQAGGPARRARLRIEHCELISEKDVGRFARLGVTCSVQPCHLLADVPVLMREFGGKGSDGGRTLARVLPLRELLDSGLEAGRTLIFGSDAPIVRPNPEDSVLAAVWRGARGQDRTRVTESAGSDTPAAIGPEQAITEAEAWACFGTGGGSIERGGAASRESVRPHDAGRGAQTNRGDVRLSISAEAKPDAQRAQNAGLGGQAFDSIDEDDHEEDQR